DPHVVPKTPDTYPTQKGTHANRPENAPLDKQLEKPVMGLNNSQVRPYRAETFAPPAKPRPFGYPLSQIRPYAQATGAQSIQGCRTHRPGKPGEPAQLTLFYSENRRGQKRQKQCG